MPSSATSITGWETSPLSNDAWKAKREEIHEAFEVDREGKTESGMNCIDEGDKSQGSQGEGKAELEKTHHSDCEGVLRIPLYAIFIRDSLL